MIFSSSLELNATYPIWFTESALEDNEARIVSDAGDVISVGSSTIRVWDLEKSWGLSATVPAVEGSTIIPFTIPSLSP